MFLWVFVLFSLWCPVINFFIYCSFFAPIIFFFSCDTYPRNSHYWALPLSLRMVLWVNRFLQGLSQYNNILYSFKLSTCQLCGNWSLGGEDNTPQPSGLDPSDNLPQLTYLFGTCDSEVWYALYFLWAISLFLFY